MRRRLNEISPPGQLRRWAEEIGWVLRLSITRGQNIRIDSGLRERWRALLFPYWFVKDSDVGAIVFCQ